MNESCFPNSDQINRISIDYLGNGTSNNDVAIMVSVTAAVMIATIVIAICVYKRYRPHR